MTAPAPPRISPRAQACLRLVWDRQATSKEIAAELGISKATVDGYIADAVAQLGVRDRRAAAAALFGQAPRAGVGALPATAPPRARSGGDSAGVAADAPPAAGVAASTEAQRGSRPWRDGRGRGQRMTLAQTVGWIAVIALGSLAALALATAIGNGLPPVAGPLLHAFDRLTR